ncbi:MAG: hypothetical protein J6U85_08045, partial [Bacteroidales bacterium]|nr:hypothetical protein [Bacteroidales bacterium]
MKRQNVLSRNNKKQGNVAKNGWQLSEKKTGNGHTKQPKLPVFFSILNLKYLPIYSNIEVP